MKTPKDAGFQLMYTDSHSPDIHSLTLGDYAHTVIQEQYQTIAKLERKVLADKDPEHLHHMRVATRRLRTALQVFGLAIELPKAASAKRISSLAKILGKLRDLDVQIAELQTSYRPDLKKSEKPLLDEAINALRKERHKVFAGVEDALTRANHKGLKDAYETWLDQPRYTTLAQLPLVPLLPDLLSPLLSALLLHPGWLIEAPSLSEESDEQLHDLRKACKHARYQAEFFKSFYGKDFQNWISDIKTIQEMLGKVHDSQVLLELLADHLPDKKGLPGLQESVYRSQAEAMGEWKSIRQRYLDAPYRIHLHQTLLEPEVLTNSEKI